MVGERRVTQDDFCFKARRCWRGFSVTDDYWKMKVRVGFKVELGSETTHGKGEMSQMVRKEMIQYFLWIWKRDERSI